MVITATTHQFGEYGGQYVPETLTAALNELEDGFAKAQSDPQFQNQLNVLLERYVGRPTPLYHAKRLSKKLGLQIHIKREDLLHTGAHKINNALGQALLACKLGKHRIVAETGAGQHGVASATVCALLGLECVIYMGTEDMRRQSVNVERMRLLGAEVRGVETGTRTLKDAVNEAIRDWVSNVDHTHYLLGSAIGPHPYPTLVRDLQAVIGREALAQFEKQIGGVPDLAVACVGGGSNAAGLFSVLANVPEITLVGVEAAGRDGVGAASLSAGSPGVLHGTRSYILQNADGQIQATNSVSAGLDYPGVGPEHAYWRDEGRVKYVSCGDKEALNAFHLLAKSEGILPALEPAHALAYLVREGHKLQADCKVLLLLSGRGDKDLQTVLANRT